MPKTIPILFKGYLTGREFTAWRARVKRGFEKYLTTRELAKLLHRSEQSIHNARLSGEGTYPRFIRVGRQVLYPETEVRAWLGKFGKYRTTAEADAAKEAA
jgi:predicted DNA-binding transcriptional regulator AlpA